MENKNKPKKKKAVQFKVETQESTEVDNAMKLFLVFEQGESGVLSFTEFNEAIHEIGLDPSSEQVKRLFNRVDSDGNGRIDFEEFLKLFLLVNKGKKKDNKEDVKELKEEERKFGVFYDDEYNYMQHLKDRGAPEYDWSEMDKFLIDAPKDTQTSNVKLNHSNNLHQSSKLNQVRIHHTLRSM